MIKTSTEDDDLYGFMAEQNDETAVDTEANAEVELYTANASIETKSLVGLSSGHCSFLSIQCCSTKRCSG
jgi:hypothetical protein